MKSIENVLSNDNWEEIVFDQLNSSNNINLKENVNDQSKTSNLAYYCNDVDRNKSESILRLMNRPGCFLIRKHENNCLNQIESPYVLSMINPLFEISHYLLYRIKESLFVKVNSSEYYNSIKHLVDAHRHDAGILPCTLIEYPIRLKSINNHLSSFIIQTNKLIRQQIIGRGHFGIVYKGLYDHEISVAIKTFSISSHLSIDQCQSNMLSEARTMMDLNHPYLVHLYGITYCHNQLSLVTEYMPNGSLLSWLQQQQRQLSDICLLRRRLGRFSLQICDAMSYLESKLIIHRDLAARNCLVDENDDKVKVTDFGMAKVLSSSLIYEGRSDTPFPLRWSSPQVLIYREYTSKSDVWSYGILLWEIYSLGQIPFGQAASNDLIAQLIQSGRMPTKPILSNELIFRKVILSCWQWKPNDRPSFTSLKETLNKVLRLLPKSPSFN